MLKELKFQQDKVIYRWTTRFCFLIKTYLKRRKRNIASKISTRTKEKISRKLALLTLTTALAYLPTLDNKAVYR